MSAGEAGMTTYPPACAWSVTASSTAPVKNEMPRTCSDDLVGEEELDWPAIYRWSERYAAAGGSRSPYFRISPGKASALAARGRKRRGFERSRKSQPR